MDGTWLICDINKNIVALSVEFIIDFASSESNISQNLKQVENNVHLDSAL